MAAPRTLAALLLLLIASSCMVDAARTTSLMQQQRRLLTTSTTTWGSHHSSEVCSVSGLGAILKPLLRGLRIYVDADLNILCFDLLWVELAAVDPLKAIIDLPLRSTGHCSGLVGADVKVLGLDLNHGGLVGDVLSLVDNLLNGLLGGLLGGIRLDLIVKLGCILGDGGNVICLKATLNNGRTQSWGHCSSGQLLQVDLSVNLLKNLLGCPTKICRTNGLLSLVDILLN